MTTTANRNWNASTEHEHTKGKYETCESVTDEVLTDCW